jgi:L-lactate dehydrogenase complex protein LldF
VKIDLDAQLYRWRQRVTAAGYVGHRKATLAKAMTRVLASPRLFARSGAIGRRTLRILPLRTRRAFTGTWGKSRDLPDLPRQSFREWYRTERGALPS